MNRKEIKAAARKQLGNGIFKENWLIALLVILIEGAIVSAASIASIVVVGPMAFGVAYLFLKQARDNEKMNIGDIFKGFADDFGGTFLIGFMSELFIFLWSLLFVIPGIIKTYAYSMVYYIKVDHPEYSWKECLDESQRMMKGHKWELFVLELSFIGWIFVGMLTFGIGMLFVAPYMEASYAQFYNALKNEGASVVEQ